MLGFFCLAADGQDLKPDQEEIVDAEWYTRQELLAAAGAYEILLPGKVSIARQLIEHWYGGPLPGAWGL
jgi:NAD+ diphosphatase